MAFFTPSSRSLTRDDIRVVSLRRLAAPGLALVLALSLGSFAGGVWIGSDLRAQPTVTFEDPTAFEDEGRFAIARVGEVVGRLKSLESDLLALRQMMDDQRVLHGQLTALDPALLPVLAPDRAARTGAGQGGALLPPRGCSGQLLANTERATLADVKHSETSARCMRVMLDDLMRRVAERNAALMAIPSRRPVGEARLGSAFGNRIDPFRKQLAFHSGVDFALKSGSEVVAAAGGRVRFAGYRGAYGNLVEIDHGNRLVTRYAHLSRLDVRQGDVITPAQRIGAVGSTGRSTGPHLHFEVLHKGRFVDPQRFLALGDLERVGDDLAED
ncbi:MULTISPECIES: M23 family metallopeptidase [Stutzerimonas stutzeri subgroup]|uniref:Peptidase M23 n=2 Tax=Gammaproteobacteria TaxID=1236 RepID=A0A2N8REE6_STUST|nr:MULTISPECIES: M23 family metallopeptidase [Stutzerimonas stutzeri subgroup]MBA1237828.1 M23 family metallopeptidase [Stutzerimonas kunmingensis]MCQ4254342.1 M23 family metallopeptidase [Stutzerimonas stutzeri]MDH2244056.1 M23 family metallopeptidase [Pseudomonas sp. GD03909]PNF59457.1 peptidase M23 [Stutzerimonas stutzeri]